MTGKLEDQLDFHRRARFRARVPNAFTCAARRRLAVQGPRDRLEQRRFARPIRPDDARQAVLEGELRVDMLTKVLQLQRDKTHQSSTTGMAAETASSACCK